MINTLKAIVIGIGAIFLGFTVLIMFLIAWPVGIALLFALLIGLPVWWRSRSKQINNKASYTKAARDSEPTNANNENLPREIYNDIKSGAQHLANLIEKRTSKVWSDLEVEFADLSMQVQKRIDNEKRKLFKTKIEEFIAENADTFDFISQKMTDGDLNRIRLEYMSVCHRINSLETKIADIKANIAMKSEPANGPFHRLLDETKTKLVDEESHRDWCVEQTKDRMSAYGVQLSSEQAQVLLSRVDAADILRMTTVFAVVAEMTEQLASTMRESGENLNVTKKYYGIYISLLELQVYVQDIYLEQLKRDYLPGVKVINNDAQALLKETKKKLKGSDDKHRPHYENNVQSLEFSLKVTCTYKSALESDAKKIEKARTLIRKTHDAAENTLKTVQVSSVLSDLVRQNEALYHEVMTLQAPELVPFENLQVQREFETVTNRIRRAST